MITNPKKMDLKNFSISSVVGILIPGYKFVVVNKSKKMGKKIA